MTQARIPICGMLSWYPISQIFELSDIRLHKTLLPHANLDAAGTGDMQQIYPD